MVTRNDVAKRAGVSSATVSRVMNDSGNVGPELREKVMKAVDELGYKPNIIAKSLRARKSYNIGYIIPDITNPYYTENFKGINKCAAARGFVCHLIEALNPGWIDILDSQKFDGLIYSLENVEEVEEALNIPIIFQDHFMENSSNLNFISVTHDIYDIFYQACGYLIENGHVKIGLITKKGRSNYRLSAYMDCLKKHDIPFKKELVVEYTDINYHYRTGYDSMMSLIKNKSGLSAIIAQNDLIAIGAMSAAGRHGFIIPKDISFIGCDDSVAAQFSNPPLSTIKLYKYKQGIKMADMLINMIEGKKTLSYRFKAKIIIRNT